MRRRGCSSSGGEGRGGRKGRGGCAERRCSELWIGHGLLELSSMVEIDDEEMEEWEESGLPFWKYGDNPKHGPLRVQ